MGKKRGSRFESEELELDMTPMIDIVFNLLIFFMCATKLRVPEGMIEAFLPKDKGQGSGTPTIELNDVRIKLLWVNGAGRPTKDDKNGFVIIKINDETFNSPSDWTKEGRFPELNSAWRRLGDKLAKLKAGHKPGPEGKGLPVIIDARKQVPTKYVISALNEVVRNKIKDVTFAAPEKEY